MRIAFDYQIFSQQCYGGISRYFVELNRQIHHLGVEAKVFAPLHKNKYLSELSKDGYKGRGFRAFPPKSQRIINVINRALSATWMSSWGADVIHETYYSSSAVSKLPSVITVYDMIHEIFPDNFSKRDRTTFNKKKSVDRAKHIICISNNTKRDLVEILGINEDKISVVYLGYELSKYQKKPKDFYEKTDKHYLLYVGSRNGYKNFNNFLEGYCLSPYLRNNLSIICFGGGKFSKEEIDNISKYNLSSNSIVYVEGDDALLSSLYQNASVFVYPSLYEGFGLPPLEAMAHDCPVACSNTGSISEVVESAGCFFDPNDPQSISKAIESILLDDSLRKNLINYGRERLKMFSWKKCAEDTLDVYRKVLS